MEVSITNRSIETQKVELNEDSGVVHQVTFGIPTPYRKLLGMYVMKKSMEQPEKRHSVSGVAREILIDFLRKYAEPIR